MKKSEYLDKYGFEIPFTEKELSLIGRDLQFCEGENDRVIKEGLVTDLRFGDATFIKDGIKYLSVQFAVGDWWSKELPTEILSPEIYSDYTDNLTIKANEKINKH